MAAINHEIKIQASLEKTYKALSNLNDLMAWHTAQIEGRSDLNEVLSFKAPGKPTFVWRIVQLEPNKRVGLNCIEGPGDSIGTKVIYMLSQTEDNRTLVELTHTSWPDHQGNFRKCNTLWGILLHHLKNYLETDKASPAIK